MRWRSRRARRIGGGRRGGTVKQQQSQEDRKGGEPATGGFRGKFRLLVDIDGNTDTVDVAKIWR